MNSKTILCLALVLSGALLGCSKNPKRTELDVGETGKIIYPKAPDGGRQIVSEIVARMLMEHPDGTALSEPGLKMADVAIAEPFRAYYVGLTDLAAGKLLSAAESRSWQYLLLHGANAVGAATLSEIDGKLVFTARAETDFSNERLGALRMAEQLPQIKKQDYELRRLDISAIHFTSVWLHGKSDDIIIPLGLTFGRYNANEPYSESQMIKLLKPEAKEKLKQGNKPGSYMTGPQPRW